MRVLLQRVSSANVEIDGKTHSSISRGLLAFVAILRGDSENTVKGMANKVLNCRIFPDETKPLNRSVLDIQGDILVVSQFTLAASTSRGNRPDFRDAERPEKAEKQYDLFIDQLREHCSNIESGVFGAQMNVSLVNDGPVTILLTYDASS